MSARQFILGLAPELVVDLFAGGGGASTGIEQALGRHVDIAVNHNPRAVALHAANHPQTLHFTSDVFEVDPVAVTEGRPVGLLWASPDCSHFSKAKGGKPVSKKVRGLAWVVVKWAKLTRPRVICLENVEEFKTWGKLGADGRPCPEHKGKTFERWKSQLESLGYRVEHRELRGCDYGAPTIRKRLFLVARCDGLPIVWPEATHADPARIAAGSKLKPWRTAADCIDWSLPCHSIFLSKEDARAVGVKRPLAEATMRRIAHGVKRYVIEAARPFIVPVTHQGDNRVQSIDQPLRTITTARRGEFAVAVPTLFDAAHGDVSPGGVKRWGKGHRPVTKPLPTVTASGGNQGLAVATLIQMGFGERQGQSPRVPGIDKPLGTVMAGGAKHAVVAAYLAKHYGGEPQPGRTGQPIDAPAPTIMASGAKHAVVAAFMAQHNTGVVGHAMTEPVSTIVGKGCTQALVAAQLVGVGGRAGQSRPRSAAEPVATITAKADTALMTAHLSHFYTSNTRGGEGNPDKPMKTIVTANHAAMVNALLVKYYGTDQDPRLEDPLHTVTTKGRFALVEVKGEPYYIADIGMRMLQPRELYRAQGFPDTYIIDRGADGASLPKDAQVQMVGNSVCPPMARAIVAANYSDALVHQAAAA